ncbi:MAG: Nif3-like dinuclear metal center hexameric protein [Deltaproteobacteria bacterium]|nr:Nif3-like dinuclear metal center hexameric protein [Deltaproteobacteria bacterium]
MIPTLGDFLRLIERIAPMKLAEPWDNPGLQIGDSGQKIKKIFSSLDPTLDALMAASETNAQVLFTHHPLIFKSISHIEINAYPGHILALAAQKHISIVTAHTNLDVAKGGINDILANLMDLQNVEVLQPHDKVPGTGLGRVGDLPEPTDLFSLAKAVKKRLNADHIHLVGQKKKRVQRIAVVGGSGGSLTSSAAESGADVLITGDVGHHAALEAKALGIALIDGGHFHTEKTAFNIFCKHLEDFFSKEGWEVGVETDSTQVDPIRMTSGI